MFGRLLHFMGNTKILFLLFGSKFWQANPL
jgi:hypothetical protein